MAFEPRDAEAAGKQVRNITVQQAGFGPYAVRVGATLWPSHEHVAVKQGDVVTLEGAYTTRKQTGQDGEERTFHNISVTKIKVHGAVDEGRREDTVNTGGDEAADEDIPF